LINTKVVKNLEKRGGSELKKFTFSNFLWLRRIVLE